MALDPKEKQPGKSLFAESTRMFISEARRVKGFTLRDLVHGYIYARWPYLYIGIGVGEHPVSLILSFFRSRFRASESHTLTTVKQRTVADTYHGKVVRTESARQLLTVREPIELRNLEQVVPFPVAKDIIMFEPEHLVALECPCRSVREQACEPLDVCLIVGEPFASFVMDHHPERARWIDAQEGIEILEAEAQRGHVHHAFFKDAMLGRFYAICNCCPCCCGAMQLMRNGTPMLIPSGYISTLEVGLCDSCGQCAENCPFSAIELRGGPPEINHEVCMGCGVCVRFCPNGALQLVRDPSKGTPLELRELIGEESRSI